MRADEVKPGMVFSTTVEGRDVLGRIISSEEMTIIVIWTIDVDSVDPSDPPGTRAIRSYMQHTQGDKSWYGGWEAMPKGRSVFHDSLFRRLM